MTSVKKNISFMIIFLILAILSAWGIFASNSNCSLQDLLQEIRNCNVRWIIHAFGAMLGFIIFEGFAISILIRGLGYGHKFLRGTVYSAADIYFSAITPSASGGQPASAFFMVKDGISTAQTTVILLVNLIMYSLSLLFVGLVTMVFNFSIFFEYQIIAKVLIFFGSFLMLLLCMGFVILLVKKQIIYGILTFGIKICTKIKLIKRPDKYTKKLDSIMEQYSLCSREIKGKKKTLFFAFFFNLLQRISHTLVSVFCYMALGGSPKNIKDVWAIQAFASLGANSIPIPGGMGVTDFLLIQGFKTIDDVDVAAHLELVSRGIAFYGSICVSVLILIVGYVTYKQREKKGN